MAESFKNRIILLADDDKDDVLLFQEAFKELQLLGSVITVTNGSKLMNALSNNEKLPDILFLDLSMTLINGQDCLSAIKQNKKWQLIPVIILSTSREPALISQLYKKGAQYYICKPNQFAALKNVLLQALEFTSAVSLSQPSEEHFVLSSNVVMYGKK